MERCLRLTSLQSCLVQGLHISDLKQTLRRAPGPEEASHSIPGLALQSMSWRAQWWCLGGCPFHPKPSPSKCTAAPIQQSGRCSEALGPSADAQGGAWKGSLYVHMSIFEPVILPTPFAVKRFGCSSNERKPAHGCTMHKKYSIRSKYLFKPRGLVCVSE